MGLRIASSRWVFWHSLPLDFLEILAAGLILTTVLVGSFLWGYVKWQKRPGKSASEPAPDKVEKQGTEGVVKIKVLQTSTPPPSAFVDDFVMRAHYDNVEFDPEMDYAQVLAEARTHLKQSCGAQVHSSTNDSIPTSWLESSQHLAAYRELESAFSAEGMKPGHNSKSPKLWKALLFWQRPKKPDPEAMYNIFSTPQHPSFRPPRKKSRKLKRGNSGPIYTDGLPCEPANRLKKPSSGPLGAVPFYGGKEVAESPYEPLKRSSRPSSSSTATPAPLYSVS